MLVRLPRNSDKAAPPKRRRRERLGTARRREAFPGAGYTAAMLDAAEIFPETIRPLRRVEYEKMVELGLFDNERVELIDGILVAMSPQGTRHAEMVRRLNELFQTRVAGRARVQIQSPLACADDALPEPDLALVPVRDYARQHPDSALLVIEVAETSLRKDRLAKGRVYARAGVPEYWIVNLVDTMVEVHTGPTAAGYETITQARPGETIHPRGFADIAASLSDLLAGI